MSTQNSDFLFMIEQAVKAPSGHNTQAWLFKINEASIEIHPNFNKSLPAVDFDNRELFIALGCATENLCIAASHKGYESELSISELGIIKVKLVRDDSLKSNPLFEQIAIRQTNRSIYNGNTISKERINILKSIDIKPNINIHFYKKGTPYFTTISNYVIKGNSIQMQDKSFKAMLMQWIRFNKNHQNRTR